MIIDLCLRSTDQVLGSPGLALQIRRRYIRSLRNVCARHTLVPQSLEIELGDDSTGTFIDCGGYGDVWKRQHGGREVAVKVLRARPIKDFGVTARVGRVRFPRYHQTLTRNHRCSARNPYRGNFFGIQTCCL